MNSFMYLHENTQRTDSECYIYKLQAINECEPIISHWHDEVEVIYCECSGSIYIEEDVIFFKKGDILFVNKQKLHSCIVNETGVLTCLLFNYEILESKQDDWCDENLISPMNRGILQFPVFIKKGDPLYNRTREVLQNIFSANKNTEQRKYARIKALLYDLIYTFCENDAFVINYNKSEPQNRIIYVKEIISYMKKNIASPISLEDLCDHVHLSKSYMIKMFKSITGQTPAVYLRNLRLKEAFEYLKNGKSVTETALCCGIDNISYFIREYKKVYGVTPKKTAVIKDG